MAQQQQRQFQMGEGGGDTKLTKIFVGGLAWETQKDTMRRYFEQFGEIVEAVVISDKNTGRSKGYGFVTFKEGEAAMRACQNMNPVIDGRRANCNLAFLGANKPRPPTSPIHHGRFRSPGGAGLVAPPQFRGSSSSSSSAFVHHHQQQHAGQFPIPYSAYGFSGYSQEGMYPMNYYNHHLYGGQQFSPYMGPPSSGSTGMFHGYYPYYPQYNPAQSSNQAQAQAQAHTHHQGFTFQYTAPPAPPLLQYPYLPHQQFSSQPPPPPILSLPTSLALSLASSAPSSSSSASTSAATTATKTVVIATPAAEASSNKDGHEETTASSSIKIED
ncbi:uncharacterized protein LOC108806374 isoform X2 [Raphanus sativus]|uniref:Uncharacterized protein LOC108806374 isoform X2 n=1 Tax=Raphanus sativus TaxID=3726 RepID=A0A9W3BY18_RAPSA|nr:uncharacterized protein LOC108806374 isoform X2 [Raphanus sativus]